MTAPIKKLYCPNCGSVMILHKAVRQYKCSKYPKCKAVHGSHPDGTPLGTPADTMTCRARRRAHKAFDAIFHTYPEIHRTVCYHWMQLAMGLTIAEAHIAHFDVQKCDELIKLCKKFDPFDQRLIEAQEYYDKQSDKKRKAIKSAKRKETKIMNQKLFWQNRK